MPICRCLINGNALIETAKGRGVITVDSVAETAVERLEDAWAAGGTVDEYTADQLVIFMALAHGHSAVLCPGESGITSLHLETAIHFTTLLTGVAFEITEVPGPPGRPPCKLVECDGLGWTNSRLGAALG